MEDNNRTKLTKCGADCSECPFADEYDCPGCESDENGDSCDIYDCCTGKNLPHCGVCPDFPCDMLRDAAFDEETGDGGERLTVLKSLADREKSRPRRKTAACGAGLGCGAAAGAIIGGLTGSLGIWLAAGAVIGGGLGLIAAYAGDKP